MAGRLEGLVTFATQGERTRAINAIQNWVAAWNDAHPEALFTGAATSTTFQYPADAEEHAGVNARAVAVDYTCTSYAGIEAAQQVIVQDVNANAYWDIIGMGTRPV